MTSHEKGVGDLEWRCWPVGGVKLVSWGRSQWGDVNVRSGRITWGKTCGIEFFPKKCSLLCPVWRISLWTITICLVGPDFLWKGEGAQQKDGVRWQLTPEICIHLEQDLPELEHSLGQRTWARYRFGSYSSTLNKAKRKSTQISKWIDKNYGMS